MYIYFFSLKINYYFVIVQHLVLAENVNSKPKPPLPTREEQLKALQALDEYDILVIGGGATGSGVALDSISRGIFKYSF